MDLPPLSRFSRPLAWLLMAWFGLAALPAAGAACPSWPAWDAFKKGFLSEGGRVVEPDSPRKQTTSEGQSYALFFALVADDRPSFDRILAWTRDNLAEGDLTAHLPAWLWGKRDDESWGVVDSNAAADADIWITYTLAEAGRLWGEKRYSALSNLLAARILREETADLPGLGRSVLPGPKGFHPGPDRWRLNPSYLPMQVLRRLGAIQEDWRPLVSTSLQVILQSAPRGFAPDWTVYQQGKGFLPDADSHGMGSYNAIRVYLWAGMLAAADPDRAALMKRLSPMSAWVAEHGTPPLETDAVLGKASGTGPVGFSAALLPFLTDEEKAARQQLLRLEASPPSDRPTNYYEHVLTLFGLGWQEARYRFEANGKLVPAWKRQECVGR